MQQRSPGQTDTEEPGPGLLSVLEYLRCSGPHRLPVTLTQPSAGGCPVEIRQGRPASRSGIIGKSQDTSRPHAAGVRCPTRKEIWWQPHQVRHATSPWRFAHRFDPTAHGRCGDAETMRFHCMQVRTPMGGGRPAARPWLAPRPREDRETGRRRGNLLFRDQKSLGTSLPGVQLAPSARDAGSALPEAPCVPGGAATSPRLLSRQRSQPLPRWKDPRYP